MKISDCMKRKVISVLASTTVQEAARVVVEKHIGTLPVVDDEGVLIGVVRLADLLNVFMPDFTGLLNNIDFVNDFGVLEALQPQDVAKAERLTMRDLMGLPVAVEEDCGLLRAATTMSKHQVRDLPVVDEAGRLVGIASWVDVGTGFLSGWQPAQAGQPEAC
ncbi:MAG: HPP family protein [Anaerolineae bacterium]